MVTEVSSRTPGVAVEPAAALARDAGARLEQARAEEVLEWAGATFGRSFALTSSMGDTVLLHLAASVLPGVPVIFLDTGYHFTQTLDTLARARDTYDVTVVVARPEQTVAEQDASHGPALHEREPDRCCGMRKVAPLERALAPFAAWGSGVRRDESPARRATPVVGWDGRRGKVKINPLARWTERDVQDYGRRHGVVMNPLLAQGYPSIGCRPCTSPVAPGADPRSGRWAGQEKTECGIHLG